MKKHIKRFFAQCWLRSFVLLERAQSRAPVLCYHSVSKGDDRDVEPLDPDLFEEHLKFLKEHYNVLRLSDLGSALAEGKSLPEKSVILTFDDGYQDNFVTVFPLLKKYEMPATIFLVSGFIDNRIRLKGAEQWSPVTWEQVREMNDSGLVDFGGHTDTHAVLTELDDINVVQEIGKSLDIIGARLDKKITLFAYPFGQGEHIPRAAIDILKERKDFVCACSTFWRTTHKSSQRFMVNRIIVGPTDTVTDLSVKIRGGYDYIYYWQKLRAFIFTVFKHKGVWK